MAELKLLPLGGMGNVTQNMYVYEYEDEMLLVDCGIGFPDHHMPGVDILIPDIGYVKQKLEQGKKIVGLIFTHGHDDHIAATPYIFPELPNFPLFASPLTAGFAHQRMQDGGVDREVKVVTSSQPFKISEYFQAQAISVTHSVPDTRHYLITTPAGSIYHGSDFKLDPSPVDGVASDLALMAQLSTTPILCALIDSLRVERTEWTGAESTVGPAIEATMAQTEGKFIITLMSSHIHRIQQVVTAAEKHGRRIAFIGRSVEQNVEIATSLKKLHIPAGMQVDKRNLEDFGDRQLCLVVAGSQGQEGSSLVRAVYGDHRAFQITPQDKVVFSADAIPGNEINYFDAIDELARNGVPVVYPEIMPALHQSGHASAPEQQEVLGLLKPQYVMPIGGADRHRALFVERVAKPLGYSPNQVLRPATGEVLCFDQGKPHIGEVVNITPQIVDGLGIGDVGPAVLSDRKALSQAGMIVLIIPTQRGQYDLRHIMVVSRGFVFMKQADEVIQFIKQTTAEIITGAGRKTKPEELKRLIEKQLARKLYQVIKREPMIVPVLWEE